MKAILPVVLFLAVAACTTQPPEPPKQRTASECSPDAWEEMGRIDGTEGRTRDAYSARVSVCAQFARLSPARWEAGYAKGIRAHCTEDNGYQLGWTEQRASSACPPELRTAYLLGHRRGAWEAERTHFRWQHRPVFNATIGIGTSGIRPRFGIFFPLGGG